MTWRSISRRHLVRLAGVVVFAAVLVVGGRAAVAAREAAAASHPHAASGLTPPKMPAPPFSILFSTVAISPTEAWAVGRYNNTTLQAYQTLVERWNGSTWSVVASPDAGQVDDELLAVAHVPNTSELWAVGLSGGANLATAQTLVEHWNGKKWSIVRSPNIANAFNELRGVTALSATNVWAVGEASNGSAQTLIEHWNGKKWSIVASPNTTSNINELRAVAGVSATNQLWAVGDYYTPTAEQTLIEYYNGTTWSIASSPIGYNQLNGVAALATNDVWAVGYVGGASYALAEHWDGTSWTLASQPSIAGPYLSGVAVEPGTNDVWAVGSQAPLTAQTLVEQWNGSSWNVVTSPSPTVAWLSGVAADSATDAWAVGTDGTNPLIERWNGTSWTIVSSPAPH